MQTLRASLTVQGPVALDGSATFVGQTYNDVDANNTQGPDDPIYPNAQVRRLLCHNNIPQNSTGAPAAGCMMGVAPRGGGSTASAP